MPEPVAGRGGIAGDLVMVEAPGRGRPLLEMIEAVAARFEASGLHFGHGTASAWDEAAWLVLHVLGLPPDRPAPADHPVSPVQVERIERLTEQRIRSRKPLAYLLGEAWFAGRRYRVDERVLVPRSPIAELIEARFAPWLAEGDRPQRILDLCAGSGCIGIACAHAFPEARVDLGEISAEALEVARANIALHGAGGRVRAVRSDLFEAFAGERYDLIVSNPPYVPQDELAALPEEYRREPALGLAAGADGLDLVRRILEEAAAHLTPRGLLVVEVGAGAERLESAYPRTAFHWVALARGGEGVFILDAEQCPGRAGAGR